MVISILITQYDEDVSTTRFVLMFGSEHGVEVSSVILQW